MPENDQAAKNEMDSLRPEAPPVDYAFWDVPDTPFKVIYSLPLFHEIDFVVNEGYRKIPHGGIEVGGLLFGSIDQDAVRISAFRPIECEHASGPSLNFSERDLDALEKQIAAAASDRELESLRPVGWVLAHTRGPLEMTETEVKHFERFFSEPSRVTVLVKPERFQPTRFGFLVRKANREMPRDATSSAVILPLPGRSHKPGHLIASLPAPTPSSAAKRTIQRDPLEDTVEKPAEPLPSARTRKPPEPAPMSIWKIPPDAEIGEAEAEGKADQLDDWPESPADSRTPAERAARKQLSRDRARVIEQAFAAPAAPPFRPAPLPSLPANAARPLPGAYGSGYGYGHDAQIEASESGGSVLNIRSITVLALAALLGCLAGYIAYLQLPAPVIPIEVRAFNTNVIVSWPPAQTRNAMYAALRLNDGPPIPLSPAEKTAGRVSLTAAKDLKIEVIARNWVRDSRGIVRYLHSANRNGQMFPSQTPPLP